jgi:hypothetical protein
MIVVCSAPLLAQRTPMDGAVRAFYRDQDYAYPLPALREVVAEKAKHRRNTFYVSPVHYFNHGASNAVVYWKEGRSLILWEPERSATSQGRRHELVWSRRFLSLDKDVVPTLADVGGSTFLLTKAMARRMIRECVRNGQKFVVYKRTRRR